MSHHIDIFSDRLQGDNITVLSKSSLQWLTRLLKCGKLYIVAKRDAGVAQLAEQLTCNQQVAGSSPIAGSKCAIFVERYPSRPKGADCKSVVSDFTGSNPVLSTIFYWGVAKSVRHGTLTPACVGSSPAAPANYSYRVPNNLSFKGAISSVGRAPDF